MTSKNRLDNFQENTINNNGIHNMYNINDSWTL